MTQGEQRSDAAGRRTRREIKALLADPATRARGLERLRLSGLRTLPATAARYLGDGDEEVRLQALQCLLATGRRGYAGRVAVLLEDPSWRARIDALLCLTRWRAKKQLPAILRLLDDPDQHVRSYAARAVGRLGSAKEVPMLRYKLARETSAKACTGYCVALARLTHHPVWLEELGNWLDHADESTRCTAANCLMDAATRETAGLITGLLRQALARETATAARRTLERHLASLER